MAMGRIVQMGRECREGIEGIEGIESRESKDSKEGVVDGERMDGRLD